MGTQILQTHDQPHKSHAILSACSLLLAEHYQELSIRAELTRLTTAGSAEECCMRLLYITTNWLRHLPSFRILCKQDQVSLPETLYSLQTSISHSKRPDMCTRVRDAGNHYCTRIIIIRISPNDPQTLTTCRLTSFHLFYCLCIRMFNWSLVMFR